MDAVASREKLLVIKSAIQEPASVLITVEDTGTGSILRFGIAFSNRYLRQKPVAWVWACPYAVRSLRATAGTSGLPRENLTDRLSTLPFFQERGPGETIIPSSYIPMRFRTFEGIQIFLDLALPKPSNDFCRSRLSCTGAKSAGQSACCGTGIGLRVSPGLRGSLNTGPWHRMTRSVGSIEKVWVMTIVGGPASRLP